MGKGTLAGLFFFAAAIFMGVSDTSYPADCSVADLSGDCRVDLSDLEIFVDQWLQGSYISGSTRAYWRMEDISDSMTPDISGNHHDLSLLNGVQVQTQGPAGSCLVLDASWTPRSFRRKVVAPGTQKIYVNSRPRATNCHTSIVCAYGRRRPAAGALAFSGRGA